MSDARYPIGGTLGTRLTLVVVALLLSGTFLSHQLFQRVGRRAIDAEIADFAYDQAGWIAESLAPTLTPAGQPTNDTRRILRETASRRNLSLVLLIDADTPAATAHGNGLAVALKLLKSYDAQGEFKDSGDRPWQPTFGDNALQEDRWPRRGGRDVLVQSRWPFAVETPLLDNLSLSVLPLGIEPVKGTGFGVGLFLIFSVLGLAAVLASGRLMMPLQKFARDLEQIQKSPDRKLPEQPVAELEQAARAVRLMATETQRATLQRDSAFAAVAGQLRPTLSSLRTRYDAIDLAALPPSGRKQVEAMATDARTAERVVSGLADWYELESRGRALKTPDTDVRRVIDEALAQVELEHGPGKTRLRVEDPVDETLPLDAGAIREVLVALFRNAIEHGGTEAALHVTRSGNKVEFTVLDRGAGIQDPDALRQIWQPFYRASTANGPGLGVGLRVARQLVELHSGGLRGRNHPEGGFETSFWLPAPPVRVTEIDRSLSSVDWQKGGDKDLGGQLQESLLPPKPKAGAPVVTAGDAAVSAEEETIGLGAPTAKNAAAKKATAKASKPAKKKAAAKKTAAKKTAAKKTAAKKTAAKKTAAKKATAKKATAKKATAKKADDGPDPLSPDPAGAPPMSAAKVASLVPKPPDETSGEDDPYAPF